MVVRGLKTTQKSLAATVACNAVFRTGDTSDASTGNNG